MTIEVFPEDKLSAFSAGDIRPFCVLVHEFIGMDLPVVNQVATGTWGDSVAGKPTDKVSLLRVKREHTEKLRAIVPTIPVDRDQARTKIFKQWEVARPEAIKDTIDNEIHHWSQGTSTCAYLALSRQPIMAAVERGQLCRPFAHSGVLPERR